MLRTGKCRAFYGILLGHKHRLVVAEVDIVLRQTSMIGKRTAIDFDTAGSQHVEKSFRVADAGDSVDGRAGQGAQGLHRAAAHLPRVDAIGGSSAGVYVNNHVRVASLFRGVPAHLFATRVNSLFLELKRAWGGIPFEVVNDGEVTALAGSMALEQNAVLGIAMGSSQAAGFVTPEGNITSWLNELAFAPIDYNPAGPVDEWSGDRGCGAQYFSQQCVGRLLPAAGIETPAGLPLPEKLKQVQNLMAKGDPRAEKIYQTIGVCFGYGVAHYADFYDFKHILVLGRVTTGPGGDIIIRQAKEVLRVEFPDLAGRVAFHVPDEKDKRHGQAVAAASLPAA